MPGSETFESGFSTRVNRYDRPFVEPPESLGSPHDAPATDIDASNSAFALLKGIAAALGVPAGSGDGAVNPTPDIRIDPVRTLGDRTDAAATVPGDRNSAIALLKGMCVELGL
jgi:hypothetical protein